MNGLFRNTLGLLLVIFGASGADGQVDVRDEDRTTIVDGLVGSALAGDHNGDCLITDFDLAIALAGILDETFVPDLDADAQQTWEDTRLFIRALLTASVGDANGDGTVDPTDLAEVAAALANGTYTPAADVNADAEATVEDLAAIGPQFGGQVLLSPAELDDAADWLRDAATWIQSLGTANFLDYGTCAGGNGEPPVTHYEPISSSWYPPGAPGGHVQSLSKKWPHNHLLPISLDWDHDTSLSESARFPPNHVNRFSSTWIDPLAPPDDDSSWWPQNHDDDLTTLTDHNIFQSKQDTFPGEHTVARSEMWRYAPNHVFQVSQTWPGPLEHSLSTSHMWPSNHFLSASRSPASIGPSHHVATTGEWHGPPVHHQQDSVQWPPNHARGVSGGWPDHAFQWSGTWRPNHAIDVSQLWPTDGYPRSWPPSHMPDPSSKRGLPGPWDLVWPPQHSQYESIKGLLPGIPDLPNWWPVGQTGGSDPDDPSPGAGGDDDDDQ
jgi:hypothetical protein